MTRLLVPAALVAALALPTAAPAATVLLTATANMKTTKRLGGLKFVQKGTVDTRPFGKGRITQRSSIKRGRIKSSFVVRIDGEKVRGKARGSVDVGFSLKYEGTATITGGTGKFANASGKGLRFSGSAPLSGSSSQITIQGNVSY